MVTTVFIADDHPLLLHGLADLIARDPGFLVVGSALDGKSALAMIRQEVPDVAVLDLRMPGLSGPEIAAELSRLGLATRCVLLTATASNAELYDAVMAGVAGIVFKEATVETLAKCIHQVASGGRWLPAEVVGDAVESEASRRIRWQKLSSLLTIREMEIARLAAENRPNGQIALDLGISKGTLKIHMNNIYRKLQVSSRGELFQLVAGQIPHDARTGRP